MVDLNTAHKRLDKSIHYISIVQGDLDNNAVLSNERKAVWPVWVQHPCVGKNIRERIRKGLQLSLTESHTENYFEVGFEFIVTTDRHFR